MLYERQLQLLERDFLLRFYEKLGGPSNVNITNIRSVALTEEFEEALCDICHEFGLQDKIYDFMQGLPDEEQKNFNFQVLRRLCGLCKEYVPPSETACEVNASIIKWERYLRKRDKAQRKAERRLKHTPHRLNAKEIKAYLDRFVIGQEEAKKTLSVVLQYQMMITAYNRRHQHDQGFQPLRKKNVLLYGPTGVGKTKVIQLMAQIAGLPLAICSATDLTAAGYKGKNPREILSDLFVAAGGDKDKAAYGIIYIDEFDKKACRSKEERDNFFSDQLQMELLRIIEGSKVDFEYYDDGMRNNECLDTTNILFILGGAFEGLDEIIRKRLGQDQVKKIGFCETDLPDAEEVEKKLPKATNEDLERYGIIRELIGRITFICRFEALSENDLLNILTKVEGSVLRSEQETCRINGVKLNFTDGALKAIAHQAAQTFTGARSLDRIVAEIMDRVLFEILGGGDISEVVVTEDCLTKKALPVLKKQVHKVVKNSDIVFVQP